MKKILTTAMVVGALYGTVNAAPITSPIYMPEAGKIVSSLDLGYTMRNAEDKIFGGYTSDTDKMYSAININLEGQMGIMDTLAINYGFDFDFARKSKDESDSGKFVNYYFGVTGRVLDMGVNKLDVTLNVGQADDIFMSSISQAYADLEVRYGLELNEIYNMGFAINFEYVNGVEFSGTETFESGFNFGFTLENEFMIGEMFTIGLDLYYDLNDDYKHKKNYSDSYNVYGGLIDVNYAINQENFVGLYFAMDFNDFDLKDSDADAKMEPTTYEFGIKFTSQF